MSHRTLDELLADARGKIERLEPAEAWAAAQNGGLIVDTRSNRSPGIVPGSLHVPLSVLQWRLAPDSAWRNPHAGSLETRLILICEHGESSSLAAPSLPQLRFTPVGAVVCGVEAWLPPGFPSTA